MLHGPVWVRAFSLFVCVAAAALVSGCAGTADFSGFARGYNEAADEANNEQVLLNIMRASHHAPYQFTALQTATGAQTLTGGLSFSVAPGGRTGGATAGGTLGTTISTAIVDTQDFYNGMSRAVPLSIVNTFLQDSLSNAVLFNLFFDRIIVTRTDPECAGSKQHLSGCEIAFHNNPRSDRDFKVFQVVMQYLFANGLTTEAIHVDEPEGKDKGKAGDEKSDDKAAPAKPDLVHLCFKPQDPAALTAVGGDRLSFCKAGAIRHVKRRDVDQYSTVKLLFSTGAVRAVEAVLDKAGAGSEDERGMDPHYRSECLCRNLQMFAGKPVEIALPTRSTLHVIEYLGAVASAQLDEKKRFPSLVSLDSDTRRLEPCEERHDLCAPLLVVQEGALPGAVTARYRGRTYSVPDNPEDFSFYALGVVRQLIALNTSSKDLPAPAVLTTVP